MLTPADMPAGYLLVISSPDRVKVEDERNPDMEIDGSIDATGKMWFWVQAEDESGRRWTVRGKVLFDLMMRHFGTGVRVVRGFWTGGPNLAAFNRLTAAGQSVEQAATGTWTGGQAKRFGFVNAAKEQLIGSPGYYGLAEFLFTR